MFMRLSLAAEGVEIDGEMRACRRISILSRMTNQITIKSINCCEEDFWRCYSFVHVNHNHINSILTRLAANFNCYLWAILIGFMVTIDWPGIAIDL